MAPALIAFVEPKRRADPAVLKNFTAYHSARTERLAEDGGFSTVSCEDGGATLYVHDRAAAFVVRDHTTAHFPEVVAIEFEKAFFSTSSDVNVVVAYISCSELEASKKYINVHQTPQLAALSEPLCNFRAAGFQVLFFGDVNGYVLDFNGYDGCESEYDAEIDATTFSGVDLPLRRASLCSHTRRNSNGKEFLSLCIAAELIIVNGDRGEKCFDRPEKVESAPSAQNCRTYVPHHQTNIFF